MYEDLKMDEVDKNKMCKVWKYDFEETVRVILADMVSKRTDIDIAPALHLAAELETKLFHKG